MRDRGSVSFWAWNVTGSTASFHGYTPLGGGASCAAPNFSGRNPDKVANRFLLSSCMRLWT